MTKKKRKSESKWKFITGIGGVGMDEIKILFIISLAGGNGGTMF